MKLIIDISKDRYDEIMSMDWKNCRLIFDEELRSIHDGKVLEQGACGDCISREAVIKTIAEWLFSKEFHYTNATEYLRKRLDELPSVTPQPKIRRWNFTKHYGRDYYVCSACGMERMDDHSSGWNYCPNCGAKMQEAKDES